VIRDDEELSKIDGISLKNGTLSCVDLPLEKLSTDETCCLLERLRYAKDHVTFTLDMEDYYRIKDEEKSQDGSN